MIPHPAMIALQVGWTTILLACLVTVAQNSPTSPEQIARLAAWAVVVTGIGSLLYERPT